MNIFSTIWGFIAPFASKILVYIVAVLLGISLIYNGVDYFKIHSLNSQVTKLTTDQKTLNDQIAGLKGDVASRDATIASQNQKIQEAAGKASSMQSDLDKLQAKLDNQTKSNTALTNKLKNQPAPKTCSDAVEYLKTNSDIFKW